MLGSYLYGADTWKKEIRKRLFKEPVHDNKKRESQEMTDEKNLDLPSNRKRFLSSPAEKSISKHFQGN